MRILMIAPEPFLSPRGTPLSIYGRLQALSALGHRIDLLTYHIGEDVNIENVRIIRAGLPGLIKTVRIGPSLAKIPLDLMLFSRAKTLLKKNRYDCIHTHEEAVVIGAVLRAQYAIRHVYDMHSSLPGQFVSYGFPGGKVISQLAKPLERWAIARCDAVIAICPYLHEHVRLTCPQRRVFVIENIMPATGAPLAGADATFPDAGSDLIALYTGSFEQNQGIELLLRAIRLVLISEKGIRFWLVGGEPRQIARAREAIGQTETGRRVVLFGKRPLVEMPAFLNRADILLSPRTGGQTVPLKIYSYLRSGKPIVATSVSAHTQVLNHRGAVLTDASPGAFAEGILSLARDEKRRRELGRNTRKLAESKYTWERYVSKVEEVYASLNSPIRPASPSSVVP